MNFFSKYFFFKKMDAKHDHCNMIWNLESSFSFFDEIVFGSQV